MNRLASRTCGPVDSLDPTVAVDDLSEFLPPTYDLDVDPTLAVNTLQEFFADERPSQPVMDESDETPDPIVDGGLETGGLGDYFRGLADAPAVTDGDRVARDHFDAGTEDVAAQNPAFQSEIQRAAMDFQRFAEKFHAFASQCQQRHAVFPTRTGS